MDRNVHTYPITLKIKFTPPPTRKAKTIINNKEILSNIITVKNAPPELSRRFIDDKKYNLDGKVFTYQITATDTDGDPLAYSLKSSPAGMTINQGTGLITWNVPSDFKGETSFAVVVNDDKGSKVTQSINFKITPEKK